MPACARPGTILLLCLVGCVSQPDPEGLPRPTHVSPAVFFEAPGPGDVRPEADAELRSLWRGALAPDFYTYTQACRRIMARGLPAIPFLIVRLDERRVPGPGQAVAVAQALIGQIVAAQPPERLATLLADREPVVRYETARLLGERAGARSMALLQTARDDPDPRVREAVDSALAARPAAGR